MPAGGRGAEEEGAGRHRRAGERLHRRGHAVQLRRSGGGHLRGLRRCPRPERHGRRRSLEYREGGRPQGPGRRRRGGGGQ
ncbi:MAG: hypothetical protein MZV64_28050 [Ignavibacteriales bacterium]|nr:hypothetical protein [Ignavibacteriales bacterium]